MMWSQQGCQWIPRSLMAGMALPSWPRLELSLLMPSGPGQAALLQLVFWEQLSCETSAGSTLNSCGETCVQGQGHTTASTIEPQEDVSSPISLCPIVEITSKSSPCHSFLKFLSSFPSPMGANRPSYISQWGSSWAYGGNRRHHFSQGNEAPATGGYSPVPVTTILYHGTETSCMLFLLLEGCL